MGREVGQRTGPPSVGGRGRPVPPGASRPGPPLSGRPAGEGTGFCGSERFSVRAGDVVCFKPGATHGIDNGPGQRMYCLELMLPNEQVRRNVLPAVHLVLPDGACVVVQQARRSSGGRPGRSSGRRLGTPRGWATRGAAGPLPCPAPPTTARP